ncbi:hypothetical protein ABKV19_002837 [Rosa sericea]
MAGIAIVLDLLRQNPSLTTQSLHASGFLSAKAAASAAAAFVAAGAPYVYKSFFSNFRVPVAYCDAGATLSEDYTSNVRSASLKIFQNESVNFGTKEYTIELKPLFSAFELRALTLTTLRTIEDDFLQDTEEEQHVDYVAPFKKSLKKIARDATVSTTKRILEKISVHYVSQRMAWKLLKDTSKSAMRKAGRRMTTDVFFFSVSKMTMRGHFLDVAASWIISVGIDIYRTFSGMTNSKEEVDEIDTPQKLKRLGNKVWGTTIRCGASLIFASTGAGIGATLFRPSTGQWIGRILGDVAGPIIVSYCLEKSFPAKL